ncbi:MAG: serine hydrolase domain-containing protein [Bacteroidota bacterium]
MTRQKFFLAIFFVSIFILTSTNQQISSSPDSLSGKTAESVMSQSEKEVADMKEVFEKYEQWLDGQMAASRTVGAAVAITYKDQVAFIKCYGTRKLGSDEPIDEHTIFRLASVSKPVTGVLTGVLAQEQVIDFDEKISEIIPWLKLSNKTSTESLTLSNLLSHTTGLVPHAYDDLVESHVPMSTILERLQNVGISAAPGQVYGYQNVMFSLVDTILAVKTSKNYNQLIKEKIFEPIGMMDASVDFESFKNNPNKAYPHRGANGKYMSLPLNDRYYSTAPAAGVNASISDMSRFLVGLLDDNNPLLEEEISQRIFEPQVVSRLSRGYFKYWEHVKTKKYALGWRMVDYKNRQIAYHGGYVNGYKAEIAISKHDNIGIVYLSNSPNPVASQSVPMFFNTFFDFKESQPVMANSGEETDEDLTL